MFKRNLSITLIISILVIAGMVITAITLTSIELKRLSVNLESSNDRYQQLLPHLDELEKIMTPGSLDEKLIYFAMREEPFWLDQAKQFARKGIQSSDRLMNLNLDEKSREQVAKFRNALGEVTELMPSVDLSNTSAARNISIYNYSTQEQFRTELIQIRSLEERRSTQIAADNLATINKLNDAQLFEIALLIIIAIVGGITLVYLKILESKAKEATKAKLDKLETKRRLIEQSQFTDALFNALPVSVITIDSKGRIQRCNPSTEKLFGYRQDELHQKNVSCLMPEGIAKHHDGYLSEHLATRRTNSIGIGREVMAISKSGESINVHLSVTSFKIGEQTHFAGILVDLTEIVEQRKEIADALITVEQANSDLEKAIIEANKATESKDMFLATASHEIRTPLTGMFGMIDLLKDTHLNEEQVSYLTIMKRSSQQLMAILNDILDAAKLKENKVDLHPIAHMMGDLPNLVQTTFEANAKEKGIQLKTLIEPELAKQWVLVDNVRLYQVVSNLCNNAIKFTEKGNVTLELTLLDDREADISVEISVSDTGSGMTQTDIERLAKPFVQLDDSLSRKGTGTGLGLSIAASLIEKMGGRLHIESTFGEGSRFSFRISLPKERIPPHLHQRTITSEPIESVTELDTLEQRPKIVVAEDNPINRMVIEKLLQKLPIDYHLVENGQELVNKVEQNTYDLIITDIQMPVMDGFEAAKLIRTNPSMDRVPIIALTAAAFEDDFKRMRLAGMNDYVAKPIDKDKLISVLELHLTRALQGEMVTDQLLES